MTDSITCPRCGAESFHPQDIAERYCGRCHRFHKISPLADRLILPGGLYRREAGGEWACVSDAGARPDVHVCRRVSDFSAVPAGAVVDRCTRCGADIARAPASRGRIVCMQCAGIEPLPQQES